MRHKTDKPKTISELQSRIESLRNDLAEVSRLLEREAKAATTRAQEAESWARTLKAELRKYVKDSAIPKKPRK